MFRCSFVYARKRKTFCAPKISAYWNLCNKSPQFRLIKRTSRAIYNLQSFICFVLIYMNDVSLRFGCLRFVCGFTTTAHRINKLFLLALTKFLLCIRNFTFENLLIFETTKQRKKTSNQTQIDKKSVKYPHSN